eukprot:6580018-Prymnesium_polylepis.1
MTAGRAEARMPKNCSIRHDSMPELAVARHFSDRAERTCTPTMFSMACHQGGGGVHGAIWPRDFGELFPLM